MRAVVVDVSASSGGTDNNWTGTPNKVSEQLCPSLGEQPFGSHSGLLQSPHIPTTTGKSFTQGRVQPGQNNSTFPIRDTVGYSTEMGRGGAENLLYTEAVEQDLQYDNLTVLCQTKPQFQWCRCYEQYPGWQKHTKKPIPFLLSDFSM